MPRGRTPMFSFNGGEVSRRMEGRSDLDGIYDRALAAMFNYVATVEGPAMKRPGFRYIKAAAGSSTWLSPFVFNSLQSYAFEWLEQRIRIYTNGGQLELNGQPREVPVPWSAADAPRISQWQSFDRLYCAHPSRAPGMIERRGAEEFAFSFMPLRNGPFKDWNTDKQSTISWAGDGLVGSVAVLTASRPIFLPGHVGGAFQFETVDYREVKAWEPQVRLEGLPIGDLRRSDGKVYSLVEKVNAAGKLHTGTIQPTHIEGDEWDGSAQEILGDDSTNNFCGAKWRYEYDRFGQGVISKYLSPTQVELTVTRRLPVTTPSYRWALGAFSNAEGWPHLVCVWNQRLIFLKGTEMFGSVVGDYFNMSPITSSGLLTPDMGFRKALGMADPPLWVHPDKEFLLLGCSRNEVVAAQINRADGLSSDNLRADPQSGYGSAPAWPVPIGTALVFVQRGARKIREAAFGYQQERFAGPNLNIYSRHITRSGVRWLAFQQEPEEMLWAGRGDGVLVAHPHNAEQAVKGFSRVQLAAGKAIAGCAIPSEDGERDELWILAELDGQKAVLQLAPWWDEDAAPDEAARAEQLLDAFFVDWGVSYNGPAKQTFSEGLAHLEGRQVRILADGNVVEGRTVTGGSVTLPKAASRVHIGLGYQAKLKLLRPEIRQMGTVQGVRRRIVRLFARLIDSAALLLQNERGDRDPMFERPLSAAMGKAQDLFNGDTDNRAVGTGSGFTETVEIVSDDPLPSIVSVLVPTWDVEELEQ